ncbi:MAG: hypothetical protein ACKPKO_38740, partial [Candidatus Fonsibacter sp.]
MSAVSPPPLSDSLQSKTYWTLCSNNPTTTTKSEEWSAAAASSTTSAPGLGWITSKLPMVSGVLEHAPHQYAQTG